MLNLTPSPQARRLDSGARSYSLAAVRALRCVYVHVPKSGGTSVARALYGNEGGGHRSIRDYARELGSSLAQYATVATVREPVDRCLSAYRYLRDGGMNDADERFADAYVRPHETAEAFIWDGLRDPAARTSLHFRPQWTFVCDLGRRLGVGSLLRFESLVEDYDAWRAASGLGKPLPHLNASHRGTCDVLSDEARRHVAGLYARDYAVLGYAQPTDSAAA